MRILKVAVFVAALGPVGWLVWAALTGNLSANPLSDITNETGVWALRFVCITLAITPLRRLTGWNAVIRVRRMAGLYAFFYGTLHFLTYMIVDRLFGLDRVIANPSNIFALATIGDLARSVGADIYKRPFITVGFTTWLTMLPLAVTSTAGWIRRLGGRTWNRLHRLIYATGVVAVLHYWWLVKADVSRPLTYGAIVLVLLSARVVWARRRTPASAGAMMRSAGP